ncbi:response regulator [Tepidibacter formicigenes]|uniref:Stage 0 sporulation protein A homolog n=1 Tax=Tepidibacter formicigenes DSM 15518 TaxID=1123349 RepID=A0A1M6Q359_9FIRM|nr:response regulator [Tepidibacter formicigenes]SHK14620.1 diguanylate cyclase (GGDEF) domain-containing protein [Tepidibacter formicigenes DSM 15518]
MRDSKELLIKSIQMFLNNQKEKIDKAMINLMKYRIYREKEYELELKRFFHIVRGTGSTLKLDYLSQLAGEYEDYLECIKNKTFISDEVFSNLLKGLGYIYEEIENLKQKYMFSMNDKDVKIENKNIDTENRGNILIVDDDINLLYLLENVFKEDGYNVITSSSPDNVMSILKQEKIDLAILDVIMPEKNGFEVLKQIKEEKINVPIIFLTAKNITKDKIKALREGVEDYITKPFQIEELTVRVECILKKVNSYKRKIIKDNLTGVYNKDYFNERLKEIKNISKNEKRVFSIAFIDFDYFKEINDKYGHLAGDYALKVFVQELKKYLRSSDEIYRFGGDEFLILFNGTLGTQAYEALERARSKISNKNINYKENDNINISFSAGISTFEDGYESIEESLERADKALYISKKLGRGKTTYLEKEKKEKKKILLIDDSNIIVHMIKDRLSAKYDVKYANDGQEGINIFKEFKPDLVITDLFLPKVDGFEVCKKIKSDENIKNTKIIILSCNCKEEDINKCFEEGADDYMIKPFSLIELEDRVEKILK